jgi:hypothetical protein
MRNESHKTLIGTIRTAVSEWRKREGWSRETVVQIIVDAHGQLDGPAATDIRFEPNTRDVFQIQKVNADRVFRWLDDEGKDTNLLPANFIPSILAALPMDLRIHCVNDLLRQTGLEVRGCDTSSTDTFNPHAHVSSLIKESAEAATAMLPIGPGTSLPVLESARRELLDVRETASNSICAIDHFITIYSKAE